MCRKRTFGEIAGKLIVCYENFTCLTILASTFGDRAVDGGKHMILEIISNIHLARLDLIEPVCVLEPNMKDYTRDTYISARQVKRVY